jgi:hypothetical protein
MHRVVSLGHMDDKAATGISLDAVVAGIAHGVAAAYYKLAISDDVWDALWDATVQLYHGCEGKPACAVPRRATTHGLKD